MSEPKAEPVNAHRLLAGARKVIGTIPNCWLVSRAEDAARARPMGRILSPQSDDPWTIRFVIDLRSRKAAELRRCRNVTLVFQKEDEEAYLSLTGAARLVETRRDVQALWNEAYGRHFPTDDDRANAGFIEAKVTRMELWIRGLTPEPFGVRPTVVERAADDVWRCAG
jgi:general stress protein 26